MKYDEPLVLANETILRDARAYRVRNNRVSLHLWSKDRFLLDIIKDKYGGNYYRHGSGMLWMCSNRRVLATIYTQLLLTDESLDKFNLLKEVYDDYVIHQSKKEAELYPSGTSTSSSDSSTTLGGEPENDSWPNAME